MPSPPSEPADGAVTRSPGTMNRSSVLVLLAATITLSGCTRPPNGPGTPFRGDIEGVVHAAVHPLMVEHAIPGMAVAVVIDGTFHFFNYGVASIESGSPVDERTLFEIGSVSKVFTALLAAYAEVGGKLSLADHPGRYIPQLRGSSVNEVRLLHLGTYTAGGLPLQFPAGVSDHMEMIDFFRRWTPVAAPGAQRRYSNPSIGLLGHITGVALGRDFAEAIETELLPALGLTQTYVRVPDHAQMRN